MAHKCISQCLSDYSVLWTQGTCPGGYSGSLQCPYLSKPFELSFYIMPKKFWHLILIKLGYLGVYISVTIQANSWNSSQLLNFLRSWIILISLILSKIMFYPSGSDILILYSHIYSPSLCQCLFSKFSFSFGIWTLFSQIWLGTCLLGMCWDLTLVNRSWGSE